MKTFVYSLLGFACLCFSIESSFADDTIKGIIAEIESPSRDLRELYRQLDEYQANAQNQAEKFDAQLLLLNILNTMDEEFLGKEAWDYEVTPLRTKEFCSEILDKAQNPWQKTFAFLCLAINYMGDGRTRELAIPVLADAITQIEGLDLEPDALSPVLAYLNEQYKKENNESNWHKTTFSGLLGIAYMDMGRFDDASQIQKNIKSPYWEKLLAELLQEGEVAQPQSEPREGQTQVAKEEATISHSAINSKAEQLITKEALIEIASSGHNTRSYGKFAVLCLLPFLCICAICYFMSRKRNGH